MMLNGLLGAAEQGREMIVPARRIVAGPELAHGRVAEHGLDTAAHAPRRLRHLLPDRLQHPDKVRFVYVAYVQVTDDRIGISLQGRRPLRPVLRVLPLVAVNGEIFLGALPEGLRSRLHGARCLRCRSTRLLLLVPRRERIYACENLAGEACGRARALLLSRS